MVSSRYMNATTTSKPKVKQKATDCTINSTFAPTSASTPAVRKERRKASVTLEPEAAPRLSLFKAPNRTTLEPNQTVIRAKKEPVALDPAFIALLRSKTYMAHLTLADRERRNSSLEQDAYDEDQKKKLEMETRLQDSIHLPQLIQEKKRMISMVPNKNDAKIGRERNRADIEQMATCTMVSTAVNIDEFSNLAVAVNNKLAVLFDAHSVEQLQQYKSSCQVLSETIAGNDNKEKQSDPIEKQCDVTRVTVEALKACSIVEDQSVNDFIATTFLPYSPSRFG